MQPPDQPDIPEDLGEALSAPEPEQKPRQPRRKSWRPKMGTIGDEVIQLRGVPGKPKEILIKLLYGERYSGKTNILLHDGVVHCYMDMAPPRVKGGKVAVPPLWILCSIIRGTATEGGAWDKLHTLVAPEWFDNVGVQITQPQMDDQKNRYCFISNKYGGWSRVVLKSIPHGEKIGARVKGIEMSYFLFEEITETDSPDYLYKPLQQLRRPTGGPMIYGASCNPADDGEEHWVWKDFVVNPVKANKIYDEPILPPDGMGGRLQGLQENFAVYHIPIKDNPHLDQEQRTAFQNAVRVESRRDPTAEDRLIYGKWTPRPSGEGLFKQWFVPNIHLKGDLKGNTRLLPKVGFPITLTYDLGQVWSSCTMEQFVPTMQKPVWLWFDEADHFNERILYKTYALELIDRMFFWCKALDYPFTFLHVVDESAVNQWRPNTGSYDAADFEREFARVVEDPKFIEKYGKYLNHKEPMRMLGCPKPQGSVASRVRMVQSNLADETLFISATCKNCHDMILHLEADKNDPEKPRKGKWLHKFDGASYGMFRELFYPTAFLKQRVPRLTSIGA